jgi:hypothetical protein
MLNIMSILEHVCKGVRDGDTRFVVIDDEHVIDSITGAKFHLYDNDFKVTYADNTIASKVDFNEEEHSVIWKIKSLIAAPLVQKRRSKFSMLFEEPSPPVSTPMVDTEGETYGG